VTWILVAALAVAGAEEPSAPDAPDVPDAPLPEGGEAPSEEPAPPGAPAPTDGEPAVDEPPSEGPPSDEAPDEPAPIEAEVPTEVPIEVPPTLAPRRGRRVGSGLTRFDWGGHLKSFALVTLPYDAHLPDDVVNRVLDPLPTEPVAQGVLDGRINLALDHAGWLHVEAAHDVTTFLNADSARDVGNAEIAEPLLSDDPLGALQQLQALGGILGPDALSTTGASATPFNTGVGRTAPQAFPLTWTAFSTKGPTDLRVQGRTDRLLFRFKLPKTDLTVGRQPVGFGTGLFFTPLDLVNPFTPATIDTEYRPGVDALRVDVYPTGSSKVTAVVAYTGTTYVYQDAAPDEPESDRVAAAAYGQGTVGVTDLGGFYGFIRGDHVLGVSVASSAGPIGLHGDATVTFPRADLDEPVFFRGVFGLDGRPTGTTTLSGEVYVQTFGHARATDLFQTLASPRVQRGEVWLAGIGYLAVALSQEVTPLLVGNVAVIMNLTDPSALLAPTVTWSISDEVVAVFGGYVGLGRRPEPHPVVLDELPPEPTTEDLTVLRPRSEFGTYPATLFVQLKAYF
jgi:hypothetical protein